MRTCMYCGRELQKGELCSCPQSVARRAGQNTQTAENNADNNSGSSGDTANHKKTTYKTGYAGGDNRFEKARDRYRAKRAARRNSAGHEGFWGDLWHYALSAVKNPVQSVISPKGIGKGAMLLISAVMGAVVWLCAFFIMRGGAAGPVKILSSMMSFGGAAGYRLLASIGMCIASGAVSGIVIFFLYTGVFYFIHRIILRMPRGYWEFCVRLVTAWVPFTVFCLAGTILSFLSPVTLAALVLCGAACAAALTFEALKTEWISTPPSRVMWSLVLGYFVIFIVLGHLIFLV